MDGFLSETRLDDSPAPSPAITGSVCGNWIAGGRSRAKPETNDGGFTVASDGVVRSGGHEDPDTSRGDVNFVAGFQFQLRVSLEP